MSITNILMGFSGLPLGLHIDGVIRRGQMKPLGKEVV